MKLYRLGYYRYFINKARVLKIKVITKLFEQNEGKEIVFFNETVPEILGTISIDNDRMQELLEKKEVKLSNYDKNRFTTLKNIEINDFIQVYLDKEKDIVININSNLISHLGYYLKYDIEYFIISEIDTEDEHTKEITKDEFLDIIKSDNTFKEIEINTKKHNYVFKKFEVK